MTYPYQLLVNCISGEISEHDCEIKLKEYFYTNFIPSDHLWYNYVYKWYFNRKYIKNVLIEMYGLKCVFCGIEMIYTGEHIDSKLKNENAPTVEHILPKVKGGMTIIENLCLSCGYCNNSKMDKIIPAINTIK